MPTHDSSYLIERLLTNTLSGAELDALLLGLHDPDRTRAYSDILEAHFDTLLPEHIPRPTVADHSGKPPASATDVKSKTKEGQPP